MGQLAYFIEFLTLTGLWSGWQDRCPLSYTSPNAPTKADVLGTWMLSILSGHRRFAHVTTIRCDGVNPGLLGMNKVISEDALRRVLLAIPEDEGVSWLDGHLRERTPHSLDALLMNALYAGTRVLVPYVPHHLSFEGVRQLVRALFPVMTRHNKALKVLGFVPTMSAEHVRQHRAVTGNVTREFGESKLLPAIRADIRLAEAMASGQPIRLYAPKSRGAEDFASLAKEVTRLLG